MKDTNADGCLVNLTSTFNGKIYSTYKMARENNASLLAYTVIEILDEGDFNLTVFDMVEGQIKPAQPVFHTSIQNYFVPTFPISTSPGMMYIISMMVELVQ